MAQGEVVIVGGDGTEHVFPPGFDPKKAAAIVRGQSTPTPTTGQKVAGMAANAAPGIGGMVGGLAGGVPGAIVGGAAGEGYAQLITHAKELPGAVTDVARNLVSEPRATIRGAVEGATTGLKDAGIAGAVQGAAEGVGEYVVGPLVSAAGKRLMQSAVKPTLAAMRKAGGNADRLVQTLLDHGISVSPGGVQKLEGLLEATNDDIADALTSASGKSVDPFAVAGRLGQTAKTFANQVTPEADLGAIGEVGKEFLDRHAGPIPVQLAQELKKGTYQILRKKYGQLGTASTEAQKALARGLKETIAAEVPEISAMNATEGQLLQALDAVGRRVALSGSKDPVGFAWVTHNPTTFLASMLDRSPAAKSYLARGLYQSAAVAAKVAPQLVRAALAALTDGPPASVPTAQSPSGQTSQRPQ